MEIGDKVKHKTDKTIATVHYSTFGFSLHWLEEGVLHRTLGAPKEELLRSWEPIKEIIHENTSEIICPYCGYSNTDEQALLEFESEINCEDCNERFDYDMTITYSTYRL